MQSKYPNLPPRRAFFVAQPRQLGGEEDLMVYTFWGDRIRQDLRHELTHAILHSVLKDVPLWLDEGLAEYFEMPSASAGLNSEHLAQLGRDIKAGKTPDLERLEKMSEVAQMRPAEYREAWAWAHLMMRSTPAAKRILQRYLQELRTNSRPGSLRPRLATVFLSVDEALTRHVQALEKQQTGTDATAY